VDLCKKQKSFVVGRFPKFRDSILLILGIDDMLNATLCNFITLESFGRVASLLKVPINDSCTISL
jgi:hypothetical protein